MTRLEKIEARLDEIEKELNALDEVEENSDAASPEAVEEQTRKIDELQKEVRSLLDAKKSILDGAEKRASLEKAIAEGKTGVDITPDSLIGGKEKMNERTYDASSKEFRSAWAKNLMGQELTDIEKRAYSQAGAAIPTEVSDKFFEKMKKLAPMLDEITLLRVAGNVNFYTEGVRNPATKHTENAEVASAADTMVKVTLGGFEFMKVVSISKSAKAMSVAAFETWIVDMLAGDIARAIDNYIINDETNGIAAIEFNEANEITATAEYTYKNIMDLIALLPAAYDAEAKFLVNKKVLWSDIRGILDSNKRPIFDPESKTLCGYPVIEDDNVASATKDVYLGRWLDVVGNLSEDVNVESNAHSGFTRGAIDYRGFATFDSKPAKTDGIVRLTTGA